MKNLLHAFLAAFMIVAVVGCSDTQAPPPVVQGQGQLEALVVDEDLSSAPETEPALTTTDDLDLDVLHKALSAVNSNYNGRGQFNFVQGLGVGVQLAGTGVVDISPLKGLPIVALDLQGTAVHDLSPLRGSKIRELFLENTPSEDLSALEGMPLQKLYISNSRVKNIGPLKGAPLMELNMLNTQVEDLSPLEGAPLQMVWLTDTPVEDVSPLRRSPLVSVTLHRTKVKDLSPLSATPLQRLHIGETPVSDLRPLKGMSLTRLIFTPENITSGMDIIPKMPTLTEIGTSFETRMDPNRFWIMYSQSQNKK